MILRTLFQPPGTERNFVQRSRGLAVFVLGLLWSAFASAQDLAMTAILQPVSGCALGAAESVSFRMFNYGPTRTAGGTILVAYSLNGGPSVNDTVTLTSDFQTNTSLNFTFAMPANLSMPGAYTFRVDINPGGDINPGNNFISNYVVQNAAPSQAGTLTGPASGSSGTLTLGASVGNVVQWEESPDNLRWFKLFNTTSTQGFSGLTATTRFRARVANPPCAAVVSNVVTVVP